MIRNDLPIQEAGQGENFIARPVQRGEDLLIRNIREAFDANTTFSDRVSSFLAATILFSSELSIISCNLDRDSTRRMVSDDVNSLIDSGSRAVRTGRDCLVRTASFCKTVIRRVHTAVFGERKPREGIHTSKYSQANEILLHVQNWQNFEGPRIEPLFEDDRMNPTEEECEFHYHEIMDLNLRGTFCYLKLMHHLNCLVMCNARHPLVEFYPKLYQEFSEYCNSIKEFVALAPLSERERQTVQYIIQQTEQTVDKFKEKQLLRELLTGPII